MKNEYILVYFTTFSQFATKREEILQLSILFCQVKT